MVHDVRRAECLLQDDFPLALFWVAFLGADDDYVGYVGYPFGQKEGFNPCGGAWTRI